MHHAIASQHTPVLLQEAIDSLVTRVDGVYVDGTYGRGGHARLLLSRLGSGGRLIAIDRDPAAVQAAGEIADARFSIHHARYAQLGETLAALGVDAVDGVLLDLGVSSPQIDDPERGFSFRFDGPLDMRMDPTRGESAAEFLQRADERHIAEVIKDYGEERFALQIAKALVARREGGNPVRTTRELSEVVAGAVKTREPGQDPATRTFQALRIFVNAELEELEQGLKVAARAAGPRRAAGRHQLPFARGPDRQDLHRAREPQRDRPARPVRGRAPEPAAGDRADPRRRDRTARQPACALGGAAGGRAHRGAVRSRAAVAGGRASAASGRSWRPGMSRFNVLLLVVLLASSLYLVHVSYEGRRLFVELDRARSEERLLDSEHERLKAEKQAQATPLRVEKTARDKLAMRTRHPGRHALRQLCALRFRRRGREAMSLRTPEGHARRSQRAQRLLFDQPAAGVAHAAVALEVPGRAGGPELLRAAGPRGLCADHRLGVLPAPGRDPLRPHARPAGQSRPHRRPQRPDPGVQRAGAVDLGDPEGHRGRRGAARAPRQAPRHDAAAELADRLEDNPNFVWLRRQVEEPVAKEVLALGVKGIHQVREYKRKYPEGEAAAHVVGFTNVEDHGQEGIELAFQKDLAGRNGTRRVIKDRLGRVVEDVGDSVGAARRPRHRARGRLQGPVLRLPAHPRCGRRAQGQGRQRRRARRADRRDPRARELPELRAVGPQEPERRPAAQPCAHRHLRARLDDEALHRRLGAGDRAGHPEHA